MSPILESYNYKVSNIVLSKKNPFTINEVETELNYEGVKLPLIKIKKILSNLIDNGILTLSGSKYLLTIDDE